MSYKLELHELANAEYIEAYEWYEARETGLGERFTELVEKRLRQIAEHPLQYSNRHAHYREVKVEQFPYTIVYEVLKQKELIHISSIRHTSRNPKRKYRRRPNP